MTEDVREEIRSAVSAILRGRTTRRSGPSDDFDHPVWKDLSAGGFHLLGVPGSVGGSGGRLSDLAVVVDLTAFHAVRVPVAEAAVLAGWMVARAGLCLPDEGLVVASLDEARGQRRHGALRLSGTLRVPWGRHADHVVTTVRCGDETLVALLPMATRGSTAGRLRTAENLAGEPRDILVLDDMELVGSVAAAPPGVDSAAILQRGALARCVQLAGAARAVLTSALQHVTEREQFGRPLARFQAVQQQLAALAAEVTALQVSADAALLATEAEDNDAGVAVAAAKATASAGAHVVAAIGHQLHGAIGYSQEHHLGAASTRLWAWREEFGSESHWHDQLAATVRRQGTWWHVVTGSS